MASPLDVLLGAQVKEDGVAVTPRRYIDFRTGLTVTDDAASDSIRVSASGGGGGVLEGDATGDSEDNRVTQIRGDSVDANVDMIAETLTWPEPGISQLRIEAVDGAIELWNNAARAVKAHATAPVFGNTLALAEFEGGAKHTVRTIASNITLDTTTKDFIGWVDASAPRSITLPAPSTGRVLTLVNVGASAVTIVRNGSEKINGTAASYVVPVANCIVEIVSNGTDWFALPIYDASAGGYVPTSRTISTTAPLTGGGDLSANRTLAVSSATTGAVGVIQLAQDLGGTGALPTVLGLTGTENVVAMHGTAILADAGAGGRVNFAAGGVSIPAGTFSAGTGIAKVILDSYGAFGDTYSAIWLGTASASDTNVALAGNNTNTTVNAVTRVQVAQGGTVSSIFTTTGLRVGSTSDPSERLQIDGRGKFGSAAGNVWVDNLTGSITTHGSVWFGNITPSAANAALFGNGTDSTTINVPTGGKINEAVNGTAVGNWTSTGLRVGDGTTATEKLDVVGRAKIGVNTGKVHIDSLGSAATTHGAIWLGSATPTNTNSILYSNGTTDVQLQVPGAGSIFFVVNQVAAGRWSGTGLRVGDVNAPVEKFEVAGRSRFGSTTGYVYVDNLTGSTTTHGAVYLGNITPSATNASLSGNGTSTDLRAPGAGSVTIGTNGTTRVTVADSGVTLGTTAQVHSIVGGLKRTIRSVSASMTVDTTTTDYLILVDSTSGTVNITLPAAATAGAGRCIKVKRSAGTNNIFLLVAGSELLDGGSSKKLQLLTDGSGAAILPFGEVTTDGTNWFVTDCYSAQVTS